MPTTQSARTALGIKRDDSDKASVQQSIGNYFSRICCINLKRRSDRWLALVKRIERILGTRAAWILGVLERIEAVDGADLGNDASCLSKYSSLCSSEWDATNNARWDTSIPLPYKKKMTMGEIGCALSHIKLWKELAKNPDPRSTMLILEDDIILYPGKGTRPGFPEALHSVMQVVPHEWDILYLGFCNFGPRKRHSSASLVPHTLIDVEIFKPTYGFYTHAYAITQTAAKRLLNELPVSAPLDVWFADNNWFDLSVYVSVVPSEKGLKGKGLPLVAQRRVDSDIVHSAHHR